jgi:hypothetical protein
VCDDGSIAEGFSESVTRLLADDWEALPALQSLTTMDASFQTFVLRHIDETAPLIDWKESSALQQGNAHQPPPICAIKSQERPLVCCPD